jgi:hypothetical protein
MISIVADATTRACDVYRTLKGPAKIMRRSATICANEIDLTKRSTA